MEVEIKSQCQKCGEHFKFDAQDAGRVIDCPHCGQRTTLVLPRTKIAPQPEPPINEAHRKTLLAKLNPDHMDKARENLKTITIFAAVGGTIGLLVLGVASDANNVTIIIEIVSFIVSLLFSMIFILIYFRLCDIHAVAKQIRDKNP